MYATVWEYFAVTPHNRGGERRVRGGDQNKMIWEVVLCLANYF